MAVIPVVPVAKNGKFFGYADADQIAKNPSLTQCAEPSDTLEAVVPEQSEAPIVIEEDIIAPENVDDTVDEEGPNPDDL